MSNSRITSNKLCSWGSISRLDTALNGVWLTFEAHERVFIPMNDKRPEAKALADAIASEEPAAIEVALKRYKETPRA